ncbi:MAG: GFA family protein [Armatimonadota bacterium]
MHHGSCLCGAVRYEIEGELGPFVFCHCARCRKANGSAFNAATGVATDRFRVVAGRDSLAEFQSSPGVYRVFCGGCGSPLYSRRDYMPETIRLRIGTLDTPVEGRPAAHIFVSERAEWFEICDDAPQYPELPPTR